MDLSWSSWSIRPCLAPEEQDSYPSGVSRPVSVLRSGARGSSHALFLSFSSPLKFQGYAPPLTGFRFPLHRFLRAALILGHSGFLRFHTRVQGSIAPFRAREHSVFLALPFLLASLLSAAFFSMILRLCLYLSDVWHCRLPPYQYSCLGISKPAKGPVIDGT